MKRVLFMATLLVALTALSGCYRTTFMYTDRAGGAVTEKKQAFWLGGLIGPNKPYRADQLCPAGIAGVETYATFGNACINTCSGGIYAPRTVKVTCAAGGAHNFYLDESDQVLGHEYVDESGQTVVEGFQSDVL